MQTAQTTCDKLMQLAQMETPAHLLWNVATSRVPNCARNRIAAWLLEPATVRPAALPSWLLAGWQQRAAVLPGLSRGDRRASARKSGASDHYRRTRSPRPQHHPPAYDAARCDYCPRPYRRVSAETPSYVALPDTNVGLGRHPRTVRSVRCRLTVSHKLRLS